MLWNWISGEASGLNRAPSVVDDYPKYVDKTFFGKVKTYSYEILATGENENNPYYFWIRPLNLSIKIWKRIS